MADENSDEPYLRDPETGEINTREVRHRAKSWIAVLVAFGVFAVGIWFVGTRVLGWWDGVRSAEDYIGEGKADIVVTIPKGSSVSAIGQLLTEENVVKSAKAFTQAANMRPDDAKKLQAGRYRLRTEIPAQTAFDWLLDPSRVVRNQIQLPEGQRMSEQLDTMAKVTKIPVGQFELAVKKPAELGLPDWAKSRPEGFFFPDTYELPDKPTAVGVIKVTTAQFANVIEDIDFVNKAKASPAKDPYTALIMASLVEREASRDEDRVKVARVFYNRLADGMPLQSDATVAYANKITGRVTTTDAERQINSPYNTYKVKGLPPGPITSPAENALEAAVTPAEGNWRYFVVVNLDTGETEFNDTFAQHQVSVKKFQEFCKSSDKC